jgi:diaminopimelate epimerase
MKFTKMHGLGNDYIYVDGAAERIPDPPRLARILSDRHRGVGGDGLIIIRPPTSRESAGRMEMYNADGSRAQMCGNGIRCVAKYILDRGWTPGPALSIETDAGARALRLVERGPDGRAGSIEVDMGIPRFHRGEVPFVDGGAPGSPTVGVELKAAGRTVAGTVVAVGNPHFVVRVSGTEPFGAPLAGLDLPAIGPAIERHPAFPERVNVEFVEPVGPRALNFRVWERGSGETEACGTGACAAVVAGVLGGFCERATRVHLRGGSLEIRWDEASGRVFMTGPATEVFSGEVDVERLAAGGRRPADEGRRLQG